MADKTPHVQLRVVVPGPVGSSDARRSFTVLERLMTLLGQIEAAEIGSSESTWGIEKLELGSVRLTLTPNRLAENASADLMADLVKWTIEGFSETEERETLPRRWTSAAVETGVQLSKCLGMLESDGMTLELLADGRPQQQVVVTRRSADNLRKALNRKRTSIGSVIGKLESITLHGTFKAGLWTGTGAHRVEVLFTRDQQAAVQSALGKRVEVSGLLVRDARDRAISVKMRQIEPLRDQDAPLTDIVGADPELTGGLEAAEHLRRMYDAS
ncbi:hypothetical protein OG320_03680 [Microbispora sp. NBC_01189]|uniref:hypothetical protein n=1 Tax=Microbispora sp. NBC_01189 TaxID=2903583 RepID=UPI002E11DCF1|nr:hypothetical protein OG320_03680 [Microbispora sp. NBC_01189]